MTPLTWTAGGPAIAVPAVAAEPAVVPANPAAISSLGSLVSDTDRFKANLAAFLRSERGKHTKLAGMAGTGPLGQSVFGSNGASAPRVQTSGPRAGAIVQEVRLGGREYHIYFHKDGRREVIALPKRPLLPTGGMLAPS